MDAQQIAIARDCLDGAYANTLSFPESVRRLMEAGFESYFVDYRRNTRTHYLPSGESLVLDNPHEEAAVAADFDAASIAAAIKWAQSGAADYNYADFNRRATASGCAGYFVSFCGRRVVYHGRTGDQHVEWFPGAAR